MSGPIKTDNASLASKVALRRWVLARMGLTTVDVLDTCSGAGKIWTAMRAHVRVARWTRCDVKPRGAGVLAVSALDALRRFPLELYTVVDIDPYGEPWEAYRALLDRARAPVAVFLTHGHVMNAQVANVNLEAVGLPTDWPIPRTPSLSAFVASQQLAATWRRADVLAAARVDLPRVTYYGLGLRPKQA